MLALNYFYIRDKKKDLAPNHAAYNPFGVDVYLSQRKIDHIARFVGLPNVSSYGELPPILVVNCQVLSISTFSCALVYGSSPL